MKAHQMKHKTSYEFQCGECSARFKEKKALTKHNNIHLGIYNHTCEVCGRKFRTKATLRNHSNIHTGKLPFEVCIVVDFLAKS
jgi:KRAB domain-containing zinc finger protein